MFSCGNGGSEGEVNAETLMTQKSDTLTLIYSENGVKQYRFYTPLMERYELAREPYMEFRYGIDIVTYDSLDNPESTLVSDYAIYYENRKLWEARGNVVATGQDDRTLYTQQLFWDQQTGRVYSNVDSKVVQDGDVFIGEGFESDDKFQNWTFRNYVGRITVDTTPTQRSDSTSRSSAAGSAGVEDAGGRTSPARRDDSAASSSGVSPASSGRSPTAAPSPSTTRSAPKTSRGRQVPEPADAGPLPPAARPVPSPASTASPQRTEAAPAVMRPMSRNLEDDNTDER